MKNLIRFSLFTLVLAFLGACSSTQQLSSAMKVAKNDAFNYRVTQHSNMGIKIMGQDMSTVGKQETDYAFKVTEVASSGDFKTEVTIDRVTFEQDVPSMGKINYDSADKTANKNSPMASLGEAVGKKFNVSYTKEGEITKTEGMQEIIGGLMKGFNQPGAEQVLSSFGTEGITATLKNLSGIIKGNPSIGSSWNTTTDAKGIINMTLDQTYTLKERKNGQAIIAVTGTAKTDPNEEGLEFQGMQISYNLTGPITGTIIVDEATGWAISSDVTPNLSGKMTVKGSPLGNMNVNANVKLGISAVRL